MQLENSFTVPAPIEEAWRVFLDIERIAPCMPGATLERVEGDTFTGRVKVKLGPMNLTYQGRAAILEKDQAAHRAVIDARGKDQRGNGTAIAMITANLVEEGSVTRVDVFTDLDLTGRPAQFGRGVMTDVGSKLLGQFADKLAGHLGAGDEAGPPAAEPPSAVSAAPVPVDPAAAELPAARKAAATAAGVVEEVAASAEQVPGEGAPARKARKAAAATRKAAAGASDRASDSTSAAAPGPADTAAAPAAEPGPAAPAAAPDAGGPVPSASAQAPPHPRPTPEPQPTDLLQLAGSAGLARYAPRMAGAVAVLLVVAVIVRRRRRR